MSNGNFEESADIVLSQQSLPRDEKVNQVPFWPILLLCSTILNVVLAILLTQENSESNITSTKPVDHVFQNPDEMMSLQSEVAISKPKEAVEQKGKNSTWSPSDSLPREDTRVLRINDNIPNQSILKEYESTKLIVQQVFSSHSNSEETGKVIIDAPVRLNSADMLWSEDQIQEAREILQALRLHQQNVTSLKNEAQELSAAWSGLIRSSRPFSLLRADSPSLNN